jgi:uncharacterized protein YggU (UPF0235/DUF167 family)
VRLAVRLASRVRADRIERLARLADGKRVLQVSVTAPPADGRANEAPLQLLAREKQLPRSDVALVGGRTSRRKLAHIRGDAAQLTARIAARLASLPQA